MCRVLVSDSLLVHPTVFVNPIKSQEGYNLERQKQLIFYFKESCQIKIQNKMVGPFWHYVNRAALADAVLKALRKMITSMGFQTGIWCCSSANSMVSPQVSWLSNIWIPFYVTGAVDLPKVVIYIARGVHW